MAAAEDQATTGITYVEGDATAPEGEGLKIIAHCNNDQGAWGAGFVMALSKKWDRPENVYREWAKEHDGQLPLGAMQLVPVEEDIFVANIVGQKGIRTAKGGKPPIRYEAISQGFKYLAAYAAKNPDRNVSIHMPRLGCWLAGGSWSQIVPLIEEHFVLNNIPVTVYTFPGGRFNP